MNNPRISARVSEETRKLVHHAANIEGKSVADFLKAVAIEEAHRVINRERTITVSQQHAKAFFAALETAPKPNKALRNAFKHSSI